MLYMISLLDGDWWMLRGHLSFRLNEEVMGGASNRALSTSIATC